jgi:Replication-relaxation
MSAVLSIGTITTLRDLLLLRTLAVTRVLDGEQIKTVGGFKSVRRTNRRLLKLVQAGLLKRWYVGTASGGQKAIYGLSPQGAKLIGEAQEGLISWKQDSLITSSQFLAHQQAVNAVFIHARFQPLPSGLSCGRWMNFREPLSQSVPLKPDGYFELKQGSAAHPMFLEVDLGTESSRVWKRKVELYLKLALGGEFEPMFHEKRFRVLVVLHSERRMDAIRKTVAKRTEKLFWFSTQDEVTSNGFDSPIWLRPTGAARMPLL